MISIQTASSLSKLRPSCSASISDLLMSRLGHGFAASYQSEHLGLMMDGAPNAMIARAAPLITRFYQNVSQTCVLIRQRAELYLGRSIVCTDLSTTGSHSPVGSLVAFAVRMTAARSSHCTCHIRRLPAKRLQANHSCVRRILASPWHSSRSWRRTHGDRCPC
jgi:hypothetical protein